METLTKTSLLLCCILVLAGASSPPQTKFERYRDTESVYQKRPLPYPYEMEYAYFPKASPRLEGTSDYTSLNHNHIEISNENFVPSEIPKYNQKLLGNMVSPYKSLEGSSFPTTENYKIPTFQDSSNSGKYLSTYPVQNYGTHTFTKNVYHTNPHQTETVETEHFHKKIPGFDMNNFKMAHNDAGTKHGEIHYHQHTHVHKHEHKQEHIHEHKQSHQHKHLHNQHHKHGHQSNSIQKEHHGYKHENHLGRKHNHHHGHDRHHEENVYTYHL